MKIPGLYLFIFFLFASSEVISQCPAFTSSGSNPALPATFCGGENITFSAMGDDLPVGGTVDWYLGDNSVFNAYSGQGTFIGSSNITSLGCTQDVEALYVLVNPDDTQVGSSGDRCDEFLVLWTGSGGFTANQIEVSNLGGGTVWNSYTQGDATIYNCPVIPLDANDPIPENAILIIQGSSTPAVAVNATQLCSSGLPVYVVAVNTTVCGGGYFDNTMPCSTCPIMIDINGACSYSTDFNYNPPVGGGSVNGWGFSNQTGEGSYADIIPAVNVPTFTPGNQLIDDFTWTIPVDFCQNNPVGTYYVNGIVNPAPMIPCTEVFTDYLEFQVNCPSASISGGGDLCIGNCPASPGHVQFDFSGGTGPYDFDVNVAIPGFPNIQIPGLSFNATGTLTICVEGIIPFYNSGTQTIILPEGMAGQSAAITITGMNDANNCPGDLSSSGTVQVNVIQSPTAGADPTINSCAGNPVVLNGSIGGNGIGNWSSQGDGTFSDASQGNSNYTPGTSDIMNGSVILEWIVTDPGAICNQVSAMTTVTISEAVEITLDPGQTICSNQEVVLDPFVSMSGLDIAWSTNGDGFFSDPFMTTTTYLPGANDILFENVELTITISDPTGLCPDVVAAQAITIQPRMMVDLPDSIFICPDENVFLAPMITGEYVSVMWMTDGDGTFDDGASEMTTYEPGPGDLGDRFIELIILVTDQSPVCDDTLESVTLVIETCSCPSVEVLQLPQPICNSVGTMINLLSLEVTPEDGNWTVLSAPPGPTPGTITGDQFNAENASPGLYELTFHLDNPVAGCPDSSVIQIEIVATPQVIIVGDDAYCNPDTIDFLANVEGQAEVFLWQSNGNGSFDATNMIGSVYTPGSQDIASGGFQVSVQAEDSTGVCPVGTDTVQISLFQPPSATLSNTTLNTCNNAMIGSVIDLSALVTDGDTGGIWSVTSGQTVDLSTPNAVDFAGITPGNVMLEYSTNSAMPPCTDSVYQVIVQVQDCSCPPILLGATPGGICARDSMIGLNDFIAGSDPGTWTITMIEGTGMLPTISMDSLLISSDHHGIFQLMYTLNAAPIAGCPDSATFELFIQEQPMVNLPHDTIICASSSIDLIASTDGTATGGIWSSVSGDGSFQNNNQVSTTYTPGPGDIAAGVVSVRFTSVDTFGFCPSDMVMMNVSLADTAFASFLLTQTVTCNQADSGSVVNLTAFITGGDPSGDWTDIDGSGVDLSFPNSVDFDGVMPGSYTFSYQTATAEAPCIDPTYTFEVIVENCECPSVALSLPDTAVCDQATGIDLNHFVLTGEPGMWNIVSQPPGTQPGFIENNEFISMGADTGVYVLRYLLNDSIPGCPASNTMVFRVDLPPVIEIIEIICSDDNQYYEVGLTSNGEEPELNFGVLVEESPQVYRITDIPLDETLVIKFRQPGTACKSSAIISPPQCDCILDIGFYTRSVSCFGATNGQIIIDSLSGSSADPCIRLNGGDCMPLDNIPFVIPGLGPGTYQLQLEDDVGCMKNIQAVITEPAQLIVDLGGDRSVMVGDSIFIDPLLNFDPIAWTYDPTIFDSTNISGIFFPTEDLLLTLSVSDAQDCSTSDQILIDVVTGPENEEVLFIPNVFTPNRDNRNDKLHVQATAGIGVIESFRIFDRWGHLVFEISQFPPNEPSIGWDGSRNGELMLPGVYVYQLIYQSGQNQVMRTGDVTLLR